MQIIDKKVLIKEVVPGRQDSIYAVKNLPASILFDQGGRLLDGVEKSQTGDGAFVFHVASRQGKDRLATVDRYIDSVWPRTKQLPKRIPNAQQPALSHSPSLTVSELESRMVDIYGFPYLDLPIPAKEDIPRFENKSANVITSETYQRDDYFKGDIKKNKASASEEKGTPVNSKEAQEIQMKCVGCGFKAKDKRGLLAHIRIKHDVKKVKNATVDNKNEDLRASPAV